MYKFRLKASAFAMSYLSNEERVRELARQIAPYRGDKPAPFISAGGLKVAAARTTVAVTAACATMSRIRTSRLPAPRRPGASL